MTKSSPKDPTPGIKLEKAVADRLDPKRVYNPPPKHADVEGQFKYNAFITCPYCGMHFNATLDTDVYTAVRCPSCGQVSLSVGT
ncbi:MAG TPA: hypothetical protein VMG55_17395 [Stellaceae bacterium]|nr:hypothetical protein [Stellaceae bacterium]